MVESEGVERLRDLRMHMHTYLAKFVETLWDRTRFAGFVSVCGNGIVGRTIDQIAFGSEFGRGIDAENGGTLFSQSGIIFLVISP